MYQSDVRGFKSVRILTVYCLQHRDKFASNSFTWLYFYRKAAAMVDAGTIEKLEAGFTKLQSSDSKSLLKKYLTREVFDALKDKKTSFGSTLLDCIQSGKLASCTKRNKCLD